MDKFTTLQGVAAIKRTGLGKGLFAERRYRHDGSENKDRAWA
jgi:hypothetical protein